MIEDLDEISENELCSDICIVGSGPAGVSLALRLAGTGISVLLLESGGLEESKATSELLKGEVVDASLHSAPHRYRHRVLGGATRTWGGRCIPLDPIDFEQRPWVPEGGWPIPFSEVKSFYPAALQIAEAGEFDFSAQTSALKPDLQMISAFNSVHFDLDNLERISRPTDFGRRYLKSLQQAQNIRVILNATCTELLCADNGDTVKKAEIRSSSGRRVFVKAEKFVVAVGGIETPRLLLNSRRHRANGIGNDNDLVGRYYMCHIAGIVGKVTFASDKGEIFHGYEKTWDGVYFRRRLRLKDGAQRIEQVGNIVMRLHHRRVSDPSHGSAVLSSIFMAKPLISYEYSKRIHGDDELYLKDYCRHVLNIIRHPFEIVTFLWDWLWKRILASRKFPSLVVVPKNHVYSLDIHAEQVPRRDSRISLSDMKDRFGKPCAKIDWRYSAADIKTVERTLSLFSKELNSSGVGQVEIDFANLERDLLRDGAYGGHHIGATRMADSPERGVVDRNCKVFGINNLYIAGSAVFPTSGQANPTLTIIALALRLADHLAGIAVPTEQKKSEKA